MTRFTKTLLASTLMMAGGVTLAYTPAQAHHSFSATFKDDAKITVEGVVSSLSFKNPHVLVYFDVAGDDGAATRWVGEGASATTFVRRRGWSADTLKSGDYIRVTGDSTHDGSPMVTLASIVVLDASTKAVIATLGAGNTDQAAQYGDNAETEVRARGEREEYPSFDAPKTLANGHPNLSLAWAGRAGVAGRLYAPEATPTVAGAKKQESFILAEDPQVFCDPPGLARQAGMTPHPFEIIQKADSIDIKYEEYGGYRTIALGKKGEKPVDSGVKTHLGDAIAYYDGDALVIETINLLENHSTPGGTTASDQATVTERFVRADDGINGAVLSYNMTINDPLYFAEPLVFAKAKSAVENYEMIENDCQPPLRTRSAASPSTSFFLTSTGLGDGANLGGLAGADAHCEALAGSVGVGERGWRAYLSTTGAGGVNAIDRIGSGPWYNSRGELIAKDKADLIAAQGITKASVVSQASTVIPVKGDAVNQHDILTGTQNNGTSLSTGEDTTCSNWTSNADGEGSALVGHYDRNGGGDDPTSWTAAHGSRGCSQANLEGTGGAGLFYCFATEQTTSESRLPGLTPAPPGAGAVERGSRERDGMSAPDVAGASAPAMGTPQTPSLDDDTQGSKTWLWAFLCAIVLAGLGFVALRKKSS